MGSREEVLKKHMIKTPKVAGCKKDFTPPNFGCAVRKKKLIDLIGVLIR